LFIKYKLKYIIEKFKLFNKFTFKLYISFLLTALFIKFFDEVSIWHIISPVLSFTLIGIFIYLLSIIIHSIIFSLFLISFKLYSNKEISNYFTIIHDEYGTEIGIISGFFGFIVMLSIFGGFVLLMAHFETFRLIMLSLFGIGFIIAAIMWIIENFKEFIIIVLSVSTIISLMFAYSYYQNNHGEKNNKTKVNKKTEINEKKVIKEKVEINKNKIIKVKDTIEEKKLIVSFITYEQFIIFLLFCFIFFIIIILLKSSKNIQNISTNLEKNIYNMTPQEQKYFLLHKDKHIKNNNKDVKDFFEYLISIESYITEQKTLSTYYEIREKYKKKQNLNNN